MSLDQVIAEEVAKQVAPLVKDLVVELSGDALLKREEAANLLGISPRTFDDLDLPRVYVTPAAPRWKLSTIRKHSS